MRGADLAAHFGISQRTIYRDMAALMEMGVPIISLPGEGYELEPGYFLPPLLFTPPEAQALSGIDDTTEVSTPERAAQPAPAPDGRSRRRPRGRSTEAAADSRPGP